MARCGRGGGAGRPVGIVQIDAHADLRGSKAANRNGVFWRDAEELVTERTHRVELPEDFPELVYVSYDVDGLDPSQMPATGTPVPGGLEYYQSLHLVESALKGRKCVGFDVVELAPDGNAAWEFTAAQIVYRLMANCV